MVRLRGFSLVELLVTIAIIGILISLLLPSVQAAREAGRRVQCTSHLKQLALAAHNHIDATRHFPAGGWGWRWLGDPDRGTGRRQPGGWVFNLLPYLEYDSVYQMQHGLSGQAKKNAAAKMQEIPIETFNCPTRRDVKLYLFDSVLGGFPHSSTNVSVPAVAHSDYACNGGEHFADCYQTPWSVTGITPGGPYDFAAGDAANWSIFDKDCHGVIYPGSELPPRKVIDGLSKTYLFGEKYVRVDAYETGSDDGDNESMYIGNNGDITRWAGPDNTTSFFYAPQVDRAGYPSFYIWGSAHASAFNMSYCDGSVRAIPYEIDLVVHSRLGNRRDQQVFDAGQF